MAVAGIFSDKYGHPDFKGLGQAFKTIFIVYYGFANYLNAVVLDYKVCPAEELFLETTVHEKYAEAAIIVFTGLFVLYIHSK